MYCRATWTGRGRCGRFHRPWLCGAGGARAIRRLRPTSPGALVRGWFCSAALSGRDRIPHGLPRRCSMRALPVPSPRSSCPGPRTGWTGSATRSPWWCCARWGALDPSARCGSRRSARPRGQRPRPSLPASSSTDGASGIRRSRTHDKRSRSTPPSRLPSGVSARPNGGGAPTRRTSPTCCERALTTTDSHPARACSSRRTQRGARCPALTAPLIGRGGVGSSGCSRTRQTVDTPPPAALPTEEGIMTSWQAAAETAVRLGRLLTLRRGYHFLDSGLVGWTLAAALASRGHLRQASMNRRWTTVWPGPLLAAELAYLGAIPRDSTAALFGHWLRTNNRWVGVALVWWATTGDSNSIQELRRRADSLARASGDAEARHYWRSIASVSRPCLALARHDSAAALEGFVVLADSNQLEDTYTLLRLQRIELLARLDRTREAAELLDHHSGGLPMGQGGFGTRALWALERGRVFERLGQRDNAIAGYSFVADYWRNADPELQPYVTEARAALKRLSGVR